MNINVAIDGPAGAGKSTIAKQVAKKFSLMYINTGFMYRGVTLTALEKGISYKDVDKLKELIINIDMKFSGNNLLINNKDVTDKITTSYISKNVSNYAAVPEVRKILVDMQKKMAEKYSVVMDGRDIGTVVLKNAPYKFFLTATPEERAYRRFKQLKRKDNTVLYEAILQEIKNRDYIDSHRDIDPLRKAEDAIEIESSKMTINQVVEYISNIIRKGEENNCQK